MNRSKRVLNTRDLSNSVNGTWGEGGGGVRLYIHMVLVSNGPGPKFGRQRPSANANSTIQ